MRRVFDPAPDPGAHRPLPGWPVRAALGAVGGFFWTLLIFGAGGLDDSGLIEVLAGALPFAVSVAWIGRRCLRLPLVWALATVPVMPLFYYVAIIAAVYLADPLDHAPMAIGAFGGCIGAALVWAWTGLAARKVAERRVLLGVVVTGTVAGLISLSFAMYLDGAMSMPVLHGLWQGATLVALFAVRPAPGP